MRFPQSVHDAVAAAVEKCKNEKDLAVAKDEAFDCIRRLPEYDEVCEMLVRDAVGQMVDNHRGHRNGNLKLAAKRATYGGPAKVLVAASNGIRMTSAAYYDKFIAGRTLGSLLGSELVGLIDKERNVAHGHMQNVKLLELLVPLVPADKTVRQAVKPRKLQQIFQQAMQTSRPRRVLAHAGD